MKLVSKQPVLVTWDISSGDERDRVIFSEIESDMRISSFACLTGEEAREFIDILYREKKSTKDAVARLNSFIQKEFDAMRFGIGGTKK